MKCDKCDLKVDSRVAHLYLFYILEGGDKVGVVFEYSSACVNQLGLGLSLRGPTVKAGSQSMTLQLLIKFMTVDHIQTVKDSHPDLKIKTDKSITRGILNRYRKIRGFYTQDSEMDDSRTLKKWLDNVSLGAKRGDGVFCVGCMKIKHGKQHDDAVHQFKGWAEFHEQVRKTLNYYNYCMYAF